MNVNTKVRKVQVYYQGANVCRGGQAELTAGTNVITIEGMPESAVTETLRIKFPNAVFAKNIRFLDPITEMKSEKTEEIQEKITLLKTGIEAIEKQQELWEKNGDFLQRASMEIGQIEDYIDKLPDRILTLEKKLSKLRKEEEKLYEELNKANHKESGPILELQLTADADGVYPFELEYYDSGASWTPSYELHAEGDGTPLEMSLKAQITQNTHEDWEGVELSLCSGRAFMGNRLPELVPMNVSFERVIWRPAAVAPKSRGVMREASPASSYAMNYDVEDASMSSPTGRLELDSIQQGSATVQSGEIRTEYVIDGPKSILSGETGITERLEQNFVEAEYQTIAVPSKDEHAYMTAVVQQETMPNMITGKAIVFYKGTFIGSFHIRPEEEDGSYRIPLGRAEGIRVWREEKKNLKSKKGVLKTSNMRERQYEINVSANNNLITELCVMDQIPVSGNKEITVDFSNPDEAVKADDTGIVKWNLHIEPKEQKQLHFGYTISWPKDKTIFVDTVKQYSSQFCDYCGAELEPGAVFCRACGASVR